MKLASWNLRHGAATSEVTVVDSEVQPDLWLLQEAAPVDGWRTAQIGQSVRGYSWGSRVLSRRGAVRAIDVPGYAGWVSGGEWSDGVDSLFVFSLHSPTRRQRSGTRGYVQDSLQIVALLALLVPLEAPLVIGGDFNFKSFGERRDDEQVQNEASEKRAIKVLRDARFAFAWRDTHKDAPLVQTLRWNKNPLTPYHSDGFLVRGLVIAACEVHATPAVIASSDHAIVSCVVNRARAV